MNIDEKIKKALEQEAAELDTAFAEERGLSDFIAGSFRSSLRGWVIAVNLITFVATGLLIWTGYEFFSANIIQDQVFWGVSLIVALICQVALKQWLWSEMNRNSIMREIKRVELGLLRALNSEKLG